MKNSSNMPRDHPRRFYAIEPREDGTVDVYLVPTVCDRDNILQHPREYVFVYVVRGVVPWPEIEEDIRRRFDAWCESGTRIFL